MCNRAWLVSWPAAISGICHMGILVKKVETAKVTNQLLLQPKMAAPIDFCAVQQIIWYETLWMIILGISQRRTLTQWLENKNSHHHIHFPGLTFLNDMTTSWAKIVEKLPGAHYKGTGRGVVFDRIRVTSWLWLISHSWFCKVMLQKNLSFGTKARIGAQFRLQRGPGMQLPFHGMARLESVEYNEFNLCPPGNHGYDCCWCLGVGIKQVNATFKSEYCFQWRVIMWDKPHSIFSFA